MLTAKHFESRRPSHVVVVVLILNYDSTMYSSGQKACFCLEVNGPDDEKNLALFANPFAVTRTTVRTGNIAGFLALPGDQCSLTRTPQVARPYDLHGASNYRTGLLKGKILTD